MKTSKIVGELALIVVLSFSTSAYALSDEAMAEFRTIMDMSLGDLGQKSARLINEQHPDEDWRRYNFPKYVFNDQETEAAYRVAVKYSKLLGIVNVSDEQIVIPCYCTCDSFGHDNLLYCFYKNGDPEDDFDEHGAQCAVCVRQALLAFLWNDLGANHEEIMAGMKEKFAPLIEKYHQHKHQ
ncbi:MAG: hypothetical protein JRF07_03650 [Deltaproteobacteria bacterium]|jgi:hypothetical protein|nr:hypothetical protein [Deltaproteobacteria bacterium]